jgi:hypothetical protein
MVTKTQRMKNFRSVGTFFRYMYLELDYAISFGIRFEGSTKILSFLIF